MDLPGLIEPVTALASAAGEAILEVYVTDFEVQKKEDKSPLTRADMASHRLIYAGLGSLAPEMPIISEETELPRYAQRSAWNRYWLVDPLDGTREFVNRNGEFTVNIALIDDGRPVFGVVHVPVTRTTYVGCENFGAERRRADAPAARIRVREKSAVPVRVVGSRSHRSADLDAALGKLGQFELKPMGSSLKFCCVAEGEADIYPRYGPTSEWDTAAAQAVVEQAGGQVLTFDGKPLRYNRKAEILNPAFLVSGPQDRDWLRILHPEN